MQRITIVLVVGLICVIGLGTTISAKSNPEGYIDPAWRGDDHTWGGEQGIGDNIDNGEDRPQIGIMPWTFVITRALYEYVFIVNDDVVRISGFVIDQDGGRDQSQTTSQVISSNRGN